MKKILGSALAAMLIAGAVVAGGAGDVVRSDSGSVQSIGITKTLGGNNNWPLQYETLNGGTSTTAGNNNWPL
ncbi:hypothetical protein BLJ79_02250 [Arthrobacter sp. UCD-GKA]|uniref:hypothetical protein n=1 Tax=Arthrobacter sp. UCD-GKA TaxID=1913576 RepID=UPI0008DCBDF1|nr:hypothetical protein [Arthrobacter sp. UCD-GKA]OIH86800.1 hypothetical protein BLJ79_02250 [Arthrobacter sp. UCD-GKA]